MATITQRRLFCQTGAEGPLHDPYHYEERTVTVNDRTYTLHTGLGTWLKVDGQKVGEDLEEEWIIYRWEVLTGLTIEQFDRHYCRIHPYFEDPMGSFSQYE